MCGIAGYVDWGSRVESESVVTAMTEALRLRGPDDLATWTDGHVAMGHSRLSVIDHVGGRQPMIGSRNGSPVALTYGGEIYNHRELRKRLMGFGHTFYTRSDTEVVLRAYLEWGPACVDELDGMFAFAVWDGAEDNLVLARDRLGIKPLYYAPLREGVAFGSELKALLAHPHIRAEVDEAGLAELIGMLPMVSPGRAVLRGIREVEPARIVTIGREGIRSRRYWTLTDHPHEDDPETTVERIRELLIGSVERQTFADVPICTLNSGGVDSAAVTAIAARQLATAGKELLSFDIDHVIGTSDVVSSSSSALHVERDNAYAVITAEHVGSRHETVVVTTDALLAAQEATLAAMDFPSVGTLNTSLSVLFHQIRKNAVVALSGEGADELFYGYRWYHDPEHYDVDTYPWHRTYRPVTALLNESALALIRPEEYARARYEEALDMLPQEAKTGPDGTMKTVAHLTNTFYLPFLLRRADRLSMSAGVEVRVPYLDHRLVQYTWNIPSRLKRGEGIEKGILRRAVADMLPAEIAWRRKSGYPASITASYQRALWSRARDIMATSGSPLHEILDAAVVNSFLDRYEGDFTDWTPTQHISFLVEMDAWFTRMNVSIR